MVKIPDKITAVTDMHKRAIHLSVQLQADADNIAKLGEPLKDDKVNLLLIISRVDNLKACAQDTLNNLPKRSAIQALTHFAEKLSPRGNTVTDENINDIDNKPTRNQKK